MDWDKMRGEDRIKRGAPVTRFEPGEWVISQPDTNILIESDTDNERTEDDKKKKMPSKTVH